MIYLVLYTSDTAALIIHRGTDEREAHLAFERELMAPKAHIIDGKRSVVLVTVRKEAEINA